MDNILKVFSTIMENPKLQQELAKKETIEEAYDYCISISGGYTIEEFKESLQELIKMVNNMPEEQLEKVSGGIKLNNKALSTMLATISLSYPLAGAAASPEETVNQQPSKISSFVKNVKEIVSKNPVESALGAAATTGLGILTILNFKNSSKKSNSDSSKENNSGSSTTNSSDTPTTVPTVFTPAASNIQNAVPPLLTTNPGENMSQDTINLFQEQKISDIINNHNFKTFNDLKQSFISRTFDGLFGFWGKKFNGAVIKIIGSFRLPGADIFQDESINIYDVNFYNNTNNIFIGIQDILQTDTSDINRLAHIDISITTQKRQPNGKYGDKNTYSVRMNNNSQRAFVIRYVQLCYVIRFMT